MKNLKAFLLIAISCAGCYKVDLPSNAKIKANLTPQPSLNINASDPTALETARKAGPGTCQEDLPKIKVLPYKSEFGWDKHYDRIIVHSASYKNCLVEQVLDSTSIVDPGQGPERFPYAMGDLAYDVLADTGYITYGDCIPADILRKVEVSGSVAVYQWLSLDSNRQQVRHCLAAKLGV